MDYISFPNLGWKFSLSDTLAQFTLFGQEFTIKWYGVLIAVGFLLATIYALSRAKEFDLFQLVPRCAAADAVEHCVCNRIIHDVKRRVAANDYVFLRHADKVSDKLFCLRDSVKHTVAAAIGFLSCNVDYAILGFFEYSEHADSQLKLIRTGNAS